MSAVPRPERRRRPGEFIEEHRLLTWYIAVMVTLLLALMVAGQ